MTQRYEVKGKIGHGGLGEVYLAYDTRLDREVALKRVKPQEENEAGADSLAADLLREAKTLSALQHPNIVTIYDVGRDDKGPFVIMEFLKGETLDQVIERGKLSTEDFKELVLQILEGMVAAQALGLVHRDLKPGNLMVIHLPSGKFQVKILDFGLAKFSRLAVPQTQDQEAGIFGSIFFMAPEQFERLPLDSRTDMYSLGCIFYQILAQKHPFDGRTPVDVMVSHLQHLVTPLHQLRSDIPAWMADWVMWLIGREMDDRPEDARKALEFFLAEKSGLPSAVAAPAVSAAPVVKIVGRAPARQTQAVGPATHGGRKGSQTQPVRSGGTTQSIHGSTTQQIRGGSHSSAVSSRPAAKRVTKKARLNWVSVLTGILVVGAGLGIFWKIYKDGTKPKENPRDILTTLKGDPPQGGPESVRLLVKLAARGGDDAKDAQAVLLKLQGAGVADAVAEELERADGALRDSLIEAAGAQPSKKGAAALLNIALKESGDVRTKAIEALGASGVVASVPELMKLAPKFSTGAPQKSFYQAIERILSREPDQDIRVKVLLPSLKGSDAEGRMPVLRLMGATGSSLANEALAGEITAGGERLRSAIEALKSWNGPDVTLVNALFNAARSGDHDLLTGAYCRTVTRVASSTGAEVVEGLRKAMPLADTAKSRAQFTTALGTLGSPEALAFAKELAGGSNAEMAELMKPVLEKVAKQNDQAKTVSAGDNLLDSSTAIVVSDTDDASYNREMHYLTGWRSPQSRFAWDILVSSPATMEVEVEQSSVIKDHTFHLTIGHTSVEKEVTVTKTTDVFVPVKAGKFTLTKPGSWRVWLEPGRMSENQALMNIRKITLKAE